MPLTYSKWGHDMLPCATGELTPIPHGLEPSTYKILDRAQVAKFKRERLGNPEHLTIMVAANKGYPDRKAFQVQLRAWAKFAETNQAHAFTFTPTRQPAVAALIYMRCAPTWTSAARLSFRTCISIGLALSAEHLAMLYNCADVFLSATMSEGFGIPIIEAQACGLPVIVTDFLRCLSWYVGVQQSNRLT